MIEHLRRDLVRGAAVAVGKLARPGLGERDQLGERLRREQRVDGDHHRKLRERG